MARFSEKRKKKRKQSSSNIPRPIFTHVKPTLSNSSFTTDDLEEPISTAKKPLMGSVEHSTLLIPAVVVVPSISGVNCVLKIARADGVYLQFPLLNYPSFIKKCEVEGVPIGRGCSNG